jgi:hypothetical protein
MGLDMYLNKRTYVQNWPHTKPEDRIEMTLSGNTKGINPDQIKYIIEEVGYWRKANAIHSWIVNNCADGVDDCQPIYMPKQKLEELHQLACFVLGSKDDPNAEQIALENLPPANGFFFGSTEIGDWYWEDIKHTINVLSHTLQSDFMESEIIYQASW